MAPAGYGGAAWPQAEIRNIQMTGTWAPRGCGSAGGFTERQQPLGLGGERPDAGFALVCG